MSRDDGVLVYCGDHDALKQPSTFQFCPLGVQLYTRQPIPEFEVLEFKIDVPAENNDTRELVCTGIVVHCRLEEENADLYRVWIKFIDLSPDACDAIQNVSREKKHICPFCRNF